MSEPPSPSDDTQAHPSIADIDKGVTKAQEVNEGWTIDAYIAERLEEEKAGRDAKDIWLEAYEARLREETERFKADTNLRLAYANRLITLCQTWIWFLIGALLLAALEKASFNGKEVLSDAVLLGITGGTTATVIGLVAIVATSLFPKEAGKSSLEIPPPPGVVRPETNTNAGRSDSGKTG